MEAPVLLPSTLYPFNQETKLPFKRKSFNSELLKQKGSYGYPTFPVRTYLHILCKSIRLNLYLFFFFFQWSYVEIYIYGFKLVWPQLSWFVCKEIISIKFM